MTSLHVSSPPILVLFLILALPCQFAQAQRSVYYGEKEVTPQIPPKDERMKVVIVSDVTNEIDDLWAIALALLSPERFDIQGFVASNYDHEHDGVGPKSINRGVDELHNLLEKAGMAGEFPIYPGSHPMRYIFEPSESEGVDFIVERAMAATPADPLWIVALGNPADLASAYLKEPAIKDRVVMFWHARTENTWPYRAHNYNIKGDIHASRMMFHAPFPLVLFDTGTHLTIPMEESAERVKPYGALGAYLHDYRHRSQYFQNPRKGFFDLGDIAALVDPDIATWEVVPVPTVTPYMDYNFYETNGEMLRCLDIDRDATFNLLFDRLERYYDEDR